MRKTINKVLFIILILFLGIVCKNTNVKAANATLSANNINPEEGQSVTVTGSVTAGAWNLKLTGAGKSETIYGYTQSNSNASDSKSITFVAGSAGSTYTFSLTGDMTDITANSSENVNKSITITVKAKNQSNQGGQTNNSNTSNNNQTQPPKEKSKVATLSNLGIRPNDFKGFKPNKYSYNVEVPNDVEKIEIYANKGQNAQTITGTGMKKLTEGKNSFNIVVKAEAGNTQTYTINVTRKQKEDEKTTQKNETNEKPEEDTEQPSETEQEESEENNEQTIEEQEVFGLEKLKIEGIELEPEFQTDIYEYKIELREDIEKLNITAISNEINSNIEIAGNENLVEGENVITIIVKSENEEKTTIYQILVNKIAEKIQQELKEEQQQKIEKFIIIGLAGLIILIIIIAVIIKIRKNRKISDDYITYDGLNNDYNDYEEKEEQIYEEENYQEENYEEDIKKKKHQKGKRFK